MINPNPVPPNLRVVELSAWVKGWNSRDICFAVIPILVSLTENLIFALSETRLTSSEETSTSPDWVNLIALLMRLVNT